MSEFVVEVDNNKKKIILTDNKIFVDKREYTYNIIYLTGKKYLLKLNNKFFEITNEKIGNGQYSVLIKDRIFETTVRSILQEKAAELLQRKILKHYKTEIKSPMPGLILKIKKKINEEISKGETVLILEAMKMENDLRSPRSGILKDIYVKEGSAVEKGIILFTIE